MRRQLIALILLCIAATGSPAQASASGPNFRTRVRQIIDSVVKRSSTRMSNGTLITTRPLPTAKEYHEITKLGTTAIPLLVEYASGGSASQQEVAMRFLGNFKGRDGFAGFQQFAEGAAEPGVRIIALKWITQYSPEETLPFLRKVAKNDSNAEVRSVSSELVRQIENQAGKTD